MVVCLGSSLMIIMGQLSLDISENVKHFFDDEKKKPSCFICPTKSFKFKKNALYSLGLSLIVLACAPLTFCAVEAGSGNYKFRYRKVEEK